MKRKYVNIFRHDFPGLQLPFYPRSTGINRFEPGDREDLRPAPFCEICWVAEGSCRFDHGGTPALVNAGSSIFRLPGEARRKLALERSVIYYATFDGPNAADFMLQFGYGREALHSGSCPVQLFERLARGFISRHEYAYRALLPIYTELLTRMAGPATGNSAGEHFSDECLFRIQSECGDSGFNITQLANRLGVHRSTVCRAVRGATGMPPKPYLESCRIERGLELLSTTRLSIKEIAERTGFSRSNYFCRLIREKTGLTPQAWRERESR